MQTRAAPQPDPNRLRGKFARIRQVLSDRDRKPLPRIAYEAMVNGIRGRRLPESYFWSMLYRRGKNPWDYISDKDFRRIRAYVSDHAVNGFFNNKLLFHYHFAGTGIPLPPLLGYNLGERFYSPPERSNIADRTAFAELLETLLAGTRSGAVFVKALTGSGGAGAFRIDAPISDLDALHRKVRSGRLLFEEALVQHPRVSEIYPHALNTVRILTLFDRQGRVHPVSAVLRFGANGSAVDNASAGGGVAAVDLETGALHSPGWRFFEFGGDSFTHHPETGFELAGFVVPHWEEVVALARAAAEHLPLKLVGWDVAITDRGPVLIEGNHDVHIRGAEVAAGGYWKHPLFRDFLKEVRECRTAQALRQAALP